MGSLFNSCFIVEKRNVKKKTVQLDGVVFCVLSIVDLPSFFNS